MNKKYFLSLIACFITALMLTVACETQTLSPQPLSLLVSSAIALTEPLEEIQQMYQDIQPNVSITYNFGASGALQQQIEQGAPADIFISAADRHIENLAKKGLLLPDTRRPLVSNRMVLIVPKESTGISRLQDLTNPKVRRIAVGEPKNVPIGQYSEELFKNLELWEKVQPKFVFGNTVRQVFGYVQTGNVDAGIVWITDVRESDQVKIVEEVAENLHSPAVFPVAVLKQSSNSDAAKAYVQFLFSNEAKTVFEKYGFRMVP